MNAQEGTIWVLKTPQKPRFLYNRKGMHEIGGSQSIPRSNIDWKDFEPEPQPKQLSDEEAITAMFNRAEELELDLYKEEVVELYNVVRDRTGGGVDLDESFLANMCLSWRRDFDLINNDEKERLMVEAKWWAIAYQNAVKHLTQRNQQEKG